MLKKLLKNKKGTAEVVGSVMFIIILMFFFTNVYLWHDAATKEMNELYTKKVNAQMDISYDSGTITLTATKMDIDLSRIWIVEKTNQQRHLYANLVNPDGTGVHVQAGRSVIIRFSSTSTSIEVDDDGIDYVTADSLNVHYKIEGALTCTVLNTLGVTVSTYCPS